VAPAGLNACAEALVLFDGGLATDLLRFLHAGPPCELEAPRHIGHANAPRTTLLARELFPASQTSIFATREEVILAVCEGRVAAGFIETRVLPAVLLNRPEVCDGIPLFIRSLKGAQIGSAIAARGGYAYSAERLRDALVTLAHECAIGENLSNWNLEFGSESTVVFDLVDASRRTRQILIMLSAALIGLAVIGVLYWRARRAQMASSLFLANMSHELRTPLNGMVGLSRILADSPLDGPPIKIVADLNSCAEALMAVINDVRDFSKLEAGQLMIERAPVNLRELLQSAATISGFDVERRGCGWNWLSMRASRSG